MGFIKIFSIFALATVPLSAPCLHVNRQEARGRRHLHNEVGVVEASNPSGFTITSSFPESARTTLQEGQNLDLWCNADGDWEWCTFTHVSSGKICDLQWKRGPWNVTVNDCDNFEGRVEYLGKYAQDKCGLRFYDIRSNESGLWKCDMESYQREEAKRGYGDTVSKTFQVNVTANNGFSITSYTPSSGLVEMEEGNPIELWCNMDYWWEWCTFKHMTSNKTCDFQWMTALDNVTVTECDFEGRYEFLGDYNNYKCGIRIEQAATEDSGEWRCDLEEYNRAEEKRGYGKEVGMSFLVYVTGTDG